jgi:hypothetical protein
MTIVGPTREFKMAQSFLQFLPQRLETVSLVQQKKLQVSGFLCGDNSRRILPDHLRCVSGRHYVSVDFDGMSYEDPSLLEIYFAENKGKESFVYAVQDGVRPYTFQNNIVVVRLLPNWFWLHRSFS